VRSEVESGRAEVNEENLNRLVLPSALIVGAVVVARRILNVLSAALGRGLTEAGNFRGLVCTDRFALAFALIAYVMAKQRDRRALKPQQLGTEPCH